MVKDHKQIDKGLLLLSLFCVVVHMYRCKARSHRLAHDSSPTRGGGGEQWNRMFHNVNQIQMPNTFPGTNSVLSYRKLDISTTMKWYCFMQQHDSAGWETLARKREFRFRIVNKRSRKPSLCQSDPWMKARQAACRLAPFSIRISAEREFCE